MYILLINHSMRTHVPCSYAAEPPLPQIRQLRENDTISWVTAAGLGMSSLFHHIIWRTCLLFNPSPHSLTPSLSLYTVSCPCPRYENTLSSLSEHRSHPGVVNPFTFLTDWAHPWYLLFVLNGAASLATRLKTFLIAQIFVFHSVCMCISALYVCVCANA